MIEQFIAAPIGFWIAASIFIVLIAEGMQNWQRAWAKPALVVYGTVGVWYLGDYLISDQMDYQRFDPDIVQGSFLQVAGFLVLARFFFPFFARKFCQGIQATATSPANGGSAKVSSDLLKESLLRLSTSQSMLFKILLGLIVAWIGMFVTAVMLREGKWLPLLWPPVQREKLGMFTHAAVGTNTSFMLAAAGYVHLLVSALFGLIALLGRGHIRWLAIVMIFVSWPYFLFDRIRNSMLALFLPTVGGYWCFNRNPVAVKVIVSLILFVGVESWFRQVIKYRAEGMDLKVLTEARGMRKAKHYGLDMLKEACWINTFIANGRYQVNWGKRYFADLVNFVPRAIWPNKPKIGWDYAAARGFLPRGRSTPTATIATGMIGQGLVNFGPYLGVVAAACLISIWIGVLSRLWLQRESLLRKLLFLMGLGLTFNMGRDITLLVLFPFVFGYIAIRIIEFLTPRVVRKQAPVIGVGARGTRRQVVVR